jgi:hypothetical protein
MIEVVILAVVTGDPGLIDLLRRGEDVLVASRLFNVEPVRKEKEEKEGCVTEDLRDQTKPVVLGTNYGLTIWGLCRRFREEFNKELSLEEATGFFDTFFEMFPGVAEYHAKAAEDALILDCVRTAELGRTPGTQIIKMTSLELKNISEQEFHSFYEGPPSFMHEEVEWVSDLLERVLGTVVRDRIDDDWSYVVLGRDEHGIFRAIDFKISFPDQETAAEQSREKIREHLRTGATVFPQGDDGPGW